MHASPVRLIFPHQLYADHVQAPSKTMMILVEDDLFFKQYAFHKQKLILHRATMRHFAELLECKGFHVETIETSSRPSMDVLAKRLSKLRPHNVSYYELTDDWLQQALDKLTARLALQTHRLASPGFLTSLGSIEDYFSHNPNRMQYFYEWQRKRLGILLDSSGQNKPLGGKWSYDTANRKKLPKGLSLPPAYPLHTSTHVSQSQQWVNQDFECNPGSSQTFHYPVTHQQAIGWLQHFVQERLTQFGPYEDAIARQESQIFHSVLSPLLNIGLLTPQQVLDQVLEYADNHLVPLESLEGFIRQIIGWREYMRATYIQYGRKMRTANHLNFDRKLKSGWWDGSIGIEPIDSILQRLLQTGYAHHIERLMVLGNSMVLLRINPNEVYTWFMSMFIDAYDWVMVPNVYAMSQFAAGELITTKPYISGSNYIIKMSDFKKGAWSDTWDALYWEFIKDYRPIIEQNYRSRMVVSLYDRFDTAKKQHFQSLAKKWLT